VALVGVVVACPSSACAGVAGSPWSRPAGVVVAVVGGGVVVVVVARRIGSRMQRRPARKQRARGWVEGEGSHASGRQAHRRPVGVAVVVVVVGVVNTEQGWPEVALVAAAAGLSKVVARARVRVRVRAVVLGVVVLEGSLGRTWVAGRTA